MRIEAATVDEYLHQVPQERKETLTALRKTILDNLPQGFEERMNYGMPSYVVPHALYPKGYHCDPELPLPFLSFASQKNFVALYHMGLYASEEAMLWFTSSWDATLWGKLDMGKSCIRFKKMDQIPLQTIGDLVSRMSVMDWVGLYERAFRSPKP
ncbi:MAG: DUF1801 domain-containing protein [Bacteroidetes bacterium]|nr:DUF1801 domain-containing protein [Bacteroidota bacterium]MDA0903480.1 DUF1801 domain-containing protein [Bacteroidota bacterium]MDA1241935.1 DUF1801 domain-containing protein [Bacteroidota bacterium]